MYNIVWMIKVNLNEDVKGSIEIGRVIKCIYII